MIIIKQLRQISLGGLKSHNILSQVSVDLKGLLRPAILMNYVRLYVLFFGKLHIHSGVYIITKQVDTINESGYMTTLNMVKVSNDVSLENRL